MKLLIATLLFMVHSLAWASASRTIDGDAITASDHSTTISFGSQTQNLFLGTPSGTSGKPTFRLLVGADLPNPSASTLGGVESYSSVLHQWINAISTSGVPSSTQPNFTDIAGTASSAQLPTGLLLAPVTQWIEGASAPSPVVEFGAQTFSWIAGQTQTLTSTVTVPAAYASGAQIKLRVKFFSSGFVSGNDLMRTVATLIRTGTDAMSSTTNQRTSTNTAVTPAGSNIPYLVSFDLTDTSGQINGVAVSAGDQVLVSLSRSTDTDVADIHGLVWTAEATYQ